MGGSKRDRGIFPNVKILPMRSNVGGMDQSQAEFFLDATKAVDIINMHSLTEGSWSADNAGYSVMNSAAISADAGTDTITLANHGLSDADKITFSNSGGALPGGLTAGVTYYAKNTGANTFKVYSDLGLTTLVDITDAGSGTNYVNGAPFESGATIDGMVSYRDPSKVDHFFFAANGKLKELNVGTGVATDVDASAGWTAGNHVDFAVIGGILYGVDGAKTAPRRWNGTAAANAAGWPVSDGVNSFDTPLLVERHNGRAVFAVDDYIIVSDEGDAESFTQPATTSAHSYIAQVGGGDGQDIVAIRPINVPGTNETHLAIYKQNATYLLKGTSPLSDDPNPFQIILINGEFGALNDASVVQVGNDLFSLDQYGVYSLTASEQSGTLQPLAINSDAVKDILGRLNLSQTGKCWGIHLRDRRELIWGMATGSSSQVNEYIVYKYPNPVSGGVPKWSRRIDANSKFKMGCAAVYKKFMYVGSYTGKIGKMFASSLYDDTGVPWRYEDASRDFGNPKQYKQVLDGMAVFKIRSNQTINLETIWKYGGNCDDYTQSLSVATNVAQAIWGGVNWGAFYWGQTQELKAQYSVPGNGGALKHILSGTTSGSGPEFLGLIPTMEFGSLISHWN